MGQSDVDNFVEKHKSLSLQRLMDSCGLPHDFYELLPYFPDKSNAENVAIFAQEVLALMDEMGYEIPHIPLEHWLAGIFVADSETLKNLAEDMKAAQEPIPQYVTHLAREMGLMKKQDRLKMTKANLKEIYSKYGINQKIACALTGLEAQHLHPDNVIDKTEEFITYLCEMLTAESYVAPDTHLPLHEASKLIFSKARKPIQQYLLDKEKLLQEESENPTINNEIRLKHLDKALCSRLAEILDLEKLPPTLFGSNGSDGRMPFHLASQLHDVLREGVVGTEGNTEERTTPYEELQQNFIDLLQQALAYAGYVDEGDPLPKYKITQLYMSAMLVQHAVDLVKAFQNKASKQSIKLAQDAQAIAQHFGYEHDNPYTDADLQAHPPHPYVEPPRDDDAAAVPPAGDEEKPTNLVSASTYARLLREWRDKKGR